MANLGFLVALAVTACLTATCHGVLFSSLQETLIVTASPQPGQVLKAGEDEITVTWRFNPTFPKGTDSAYKTVQAKLCFAPVSQQDRAWRRMVDNLEKDKTCQHKIGAGPYAPAASNFTWTVQKDVPKATYFIRVYAHGYAGEVVAYGQTTDGNKKSNLFQVESISGRHLTLDIASVCFSSFSIASLVAFFLFERRKSKKAAMAVEMK